MKENAHLPQTGFVKKLIWIPYCLKVVEASVANSKCSITGQQGMLDAKPDGLGAVSLSTGTLCKQLYSANRYAYRL